MAEKLITCPYIPSHQLRIGTRLQTHLMKCRTNTLKDTTSPFHKNATEIEICDLDHTHHVHKSKMAKHLQQCPAATKPLKQKYTMQEEEPMPYWKKAMPLVHVAADNVGDDDEDWDNAGPVTYDPKLKIANSDQTFLNVPYGMTPSERRLHRQDNRTKSNWSSLDDSLTESDQNFEPAPRKNNKDDKPNDGPAEVEYKPLSLPQKVDKSSPPASLSRGRGRGRGNRNFGEENIGMENLRICGRGRGYPKPPPPGRGNRNMGEEKIGLENLRICGRGICGRGRGYPKAPPPGFGQ